MAWFVGNLGHEAKENKTPYIQMYLYQAERQNTRNALESHMDIQLTDITIRDDQYSPTAS